MNCRRLTSDVRNVQPGDEVYVDFARFVWSKEMVDKERRTNEFGMAMMGMQPAVFKGRRKILGLIPCGTVVELGPHRKEK